MGKLTAAVSRRLLALALLIALACAMAAPVSALAEAKGKVVRVGWYESPFNQTDKSGRRSGYAYEYQLKLAAYNGWQYEYVEGTWTSLMQMLVDGEIDLMSDVSYTPQRAQTMLYSALPMGTEGYYIFIASGNREIAPEDYASLEGKRIGVNQGSVQAGLYLDWAEKHGVHAQLVELTGSEEESLAMLEAGELDGYITLDAFGDLARTTPVCKIGSSDFYFAVNRDRPDLLSELNGAMQRIQDENRYYNQQMFIRHLVRTGANAFLAPDEAEWLGGHGTIRVGYQDNYLAFCAVDEETGELTGALKDFLAYASDCMANAHINFKALPYGTASEAMAALNRGEVDCVFPANLTGFDGETMNVVITPTLLRAEIDAVVYVDEASVFANKEHVIVAVNEGDPNYDSFLIERFPGWRKVYYPDTAACLKAVSDGIADCVLINNYRYNNIARLCEQYSLTTLATGEGIDYCFAVGSGGTELYSILAKVIGLVPASTVNAALSYYIAKDARPTLSDYLRDHMAAVLAIAAAVLVVILFLLARSLRAEKKAQRLISATETDDLTGLYNRNFFFQYANRMFRDRPDAPMDAIVVNIEQFHSVNALNGREFGDRVLQVLGSDISAVARENGGIAGRFGADRFDIYCRHMEDYRPVFDRLQAKLDAIAPNASIRLRMGVMPWHAKGSPSSCSTGPARHAAWPAATTRST